MRKDWIRWFFLTLVFLSGCATENIGIESFETIPEKEKEFKALYSDVNMNHAIVLSDETQPFDKEDGVVGIGVTNISDNRICFPIGLNITLLSFNEENPEWIELKNNTRYVSISDEIVLGPSGDIFDYTITTAKPDLENIVSKPTEIRIVVWGKNCNELSNGEKEGAYIDLIVE